jgi:hypothetical protein
MKHDLIVFAEDWGQLPSSTQHLIKHLAPNRKIIWVNSIGLRKPQFTLHDIKRVYDKLTQPKTQAVSSSPTAPFQTITLKTIPAPKSKFARWIAKKLICYQLIPILKQTQLYQPILWASLPTVADLCGALGEYGVIYYCGDDFNALTGVDHTTVTQHEITLVAKANLILTASMVLYNKFPKKKTQYYHNNLYLLGEKPHSSLPQYSQHWQVSLLPFINNAQIKSCNPLKLLEYLATGTPIISTSFPAVLPYKSVVDIARNATEFSMSLQSIKTSWHNTQTIDTIETSKRLQQIALSKQQTWDVKAQQLEQWLDAL